MSLQAEFEGLTGDIRFAESGRRENYTLHVVEMTVNSAMVKVRDVGTKKNENRYNRLANPLLRVPEKYCSCRRIKAMILIVLLVFC